MKHRYEVILPVLLLIVAVACDSLRGDADAEAAARGWAEAYFNYDYMQAMSLTADEDQPRLRFAASNVTPQDVTLLNETESAEVQSMEVVEGSDSTATAYITMSHVLQPDSIGGSLRRIEDARFELPMVKRKGSWKVRLAELPRSQRR